MAALSLCSTAVLVTAGLVSPPPIYGAGPGTALFSGRLLHHDGTPAAGVAVTTSRLDTTGATPDTAEMTTTDVGHGQTDADGYVTIYTPTVDYQANYQLSGVVDDAELIYDFMPEAPAPAPGGSAAKALALRATQPTNAAVIKAGTGPLTTPA